MNKHIATFSADHEFHHDQLVKMSRQSKYIRAFSNMMFSGEDAYKKGWIRIAQWAMGESGGAKYHLGDIAGFYCVRHKKRSPETMLYFLMVDPRFEGQGIGRILMGSLEEHTPHNRIALKVEKENEGAIAFYKKLGYVVESDEAYGGKGLLMAKENFK